MEVTKDKVTVLMSRAIHADELNEKDILKAQEEAKKAIANSGKPQDRSIAEMALHQAMVDMKVLSRLRHRNSSGSSSH